jgi:hypothetical protein
MMWFEISDDGSKVRYLVAQNKAESERVEWLRGWCDGCLTEVIDDVSASGVSQLGVSENTRWVDLRANGWR